VEAEREKREKILYLSFLSVCDDFCQKFFSFVVQQKLFSSCKNQTSKETKKKKI
jgi:hypothetical protein